MADSSGEVGMEAPPGGRLAMRNPLAWWTLTPARPPRFARRFVFKELFPRGNWV